MNFHLPTFVKTFVLSGLAAVGVALANGVTVHSLTELAHLGWIILIAFVAGGIHALFPSAPAITPSSN